MCECQMALLSCFHKIVLGVIIWNYCSLLLLCNEVKYTLEDIIKIEPIAKFTHSPLIVNMCLLTLSRLGHIGPY